jgi:TPR repeat protein
VSDLYDANQSRLRVAHRHLSENDRLYRISLVAAPVALVVALTAGTLSLVWRPAPPLPPPAVPVQPPAPSPPAPQAVNLQDLRNRAETDAAALGELNTRANAGSAEAQFYLATLYDPTMPSVRFAKNGATAAQWYQRAAAQSYPYAETNLGWLYENGQGLPKDEAQAASWYRKAADHGDAQGQINLGWLYEMGQGVVKDEAEAARWYQKAADLGAPVGADNLGHLYEAGRGVAQDEAQAALLYRKAADAGLASAQADLGRLYENGSGVPKDATEAARWYQKAVDQNNRYAEGQLGRMYATGEGVPRDLDRALALFRRGASDGDPSAIYNLALSLDKGWGAPRNALAAYIWYGIAAHWGDPNRQSQAATERDRLAREIAPDDLAAAQRAAGNWRPGSHGRIGAAIQDLTPAEAQAIHSAQPKGVVITKVEDGSPAQRAGLAAQDVVTAIDGEPIANAAAFRDLIWLDAPGQTVGLWVEKSGQRGSLQNIRVPLDQAPS